jgi:hypothetical protein
MMNGFMKLDEGLLPLIPSLLMKFQWLARRFGKVLNLCVGGIQVILSEDFYQLPPNPDMLCGDGGNFCFEADFFQTCFPHIFALKNVHRQTDIDLIKFINELKKGEPSHETNNYIQNLSRPLFTGNNKNTIKLCVRNLDVDLYNYEQLQCLDGQIKIYDASDSGDFFYLKKMIVQKK